jgi:YD repeat-containing protein
MPENNLFMGVIPQQVYFMPALNSYQTSGYSSPNGMPVYAWYYVTFLCSDSGRPTNEPCVNYNPTKNLGCPCDKAGNSPYVGNPINIATGSKYQEEQDFVQGDLSLRRYYNSAGQVRASHNGLQWLNSYDRAITFLYSSFSNSAGNPSPPTQVTVQRPDGRELVFNKVNGTWHGDTDVGDQLTEIDDGGGYVGAWTLLVADTGYTENYSANGSLLSVVDHGRPLLTLSYTDGTQVSPGSGTVLAADLLWKVTDAYGRSLTFDYDNLQNLISVTLPDGGAIGYGYKAGYLTSVTSPDGKSRQYLYDEASYSAAGTNQGKLTGIVDENAARYATFNYQADGRAISTQHGNGADLNAVSYASSGTAATVTYPLGQQATATFIAPQGTAVVSNMSGDCGKACGQQYQSQTLDANGYPAVATDFNGNVTKTTYDINGLLEQKIDASGTPSQRTTNFIWNVTLRVPLARTVLDANGNTVGNRQWVYNSAGQTLARCEVDPSNSAASGYSCGNMGTVPAGVRRWTYTYCTAIDTTQCPIVGLMLTATGPRTDITQTTSYSYYIASSATNCGTPGAACYQAGDLHTVTDSLGHVTTITSYDADGRVTRITDANGINTDMTYTPRGWLASRSVGGAVTSFTYMPYGAVQTITDADNVTTTYGYDAAHRLVKITDAQGNYIQYTLDAAGNKTAEQVYDSATTLHKSLARTFNTLGQLTKVMDGLNHTIFDASASGSHDANGNLVQSSDGLGIQRQLGYDALNRLVQTIDNYNGTN